MAAAGRRRNPFVSSARGGRILSAVQLPLFLLRPPAGYGVLTTIGRRTHKQRRRCVRVVPSGDKAYLVAIKGARTTGWLKNLRANPAVLLRLPSGRFAGRARELQGEAERRQARDVYCGRVGAFDYLAYAQWRPGMPNRRRIAELLHDWFDHGTVVVLELREPVKAGGGYTVDMPDDRPPP